MQATIKDIRKETGLSLATISKYLNGGNVLPENREKLDAAVKKLNYRVNEIARGLVTNRTKTIGVVVYSISTLFNGVLVRYIGQALRERGYSMLIFDSADDSDIEAKNIQFMIDKKVDGIITIPHAEDASFLKPALTENIPVVLIDRDLKDSDLDCVLLNNREAAEQAVRYLHGFGHEKIAIICSNTEYTGIERREGYREALKKLGLPVRDEYITGTEHSIACGYESMKQLMQLPDPPTAILMTSYDINFGVVTACNELGIACPEKVSLLGFDNLLLPQVVRPHMTVMKQPMRKIAECAVERLFNRMTKTTNKMTDQLSNETVSAENDSIESVRFAGKQIILEAELIPGESVGPPA